MVKLTAVDVTGQDVLCAHCDLRRDLHIFARYVQHREIKRAYRSNDLPKADALRLAKLMSDPEAVAEVQETSQSGWVDYVDWLALKLGLVSYDTKGTYVGYSSAEPSFPDNYVVFNEKKYRRFLKSSLADQEHLLLDTLVGEREGCSSEFYHAGALGRLSGFSNRGCAVGVVPTIDFPQVRRFLLDLLQECEPGVWYSTASLIQHLKAAHPYFLIPKDPKPNRWGRDEGRYSSFHESKDRWGYEFDIPESAPDAFERVEGRYVERFLEGIPLLLGYVDVAYGGKSQKEIYPSIGSLRAFRVNPRLRRALQRDMPPARVTVQPNYEIYVESEFYPAQVLAQLTPLAEVVSEDVTTILRLQKEKVAAQLVQDERLDVAALLTKLAERELPANVAREIAEWADHSEKFVLFDGFALYEGEGDLAIVDPFTAEHIAPGLRIVRSPTRLLAELEKAEQVPLRVKHTVALSPLPERARTVFPRQLPAALKPRQKESLALRRQTTITLHFPAVEALEVVRRALLEARCPAEVDRGNLSVTFAKRYEAQVAEAMQILADEYRVDIEDVE